MKEDVSKIIEHYGVNHQQRKLAEEVFELQEAIMDARNEECGFYDQVESYHKKHIAEEIADVMVMLKEFQSYFDIGNEHIERNIKYKVERTLKRIEEEK